MGAAAGFGHRQRRQPTVWTAQHQGKTPRTSKADRPRPEWAEGFGAIPLAKIGRFRHVKRYDNYTVMTTADDLDGRHWTTRGIYVLDGETGHTLHTTLADA